MKCDRNKLDIGSIFKYIEFDEIPNERSLARQTKFWNSIFRMDEKHKLQLTMIFFAKQLVVFGLGNFDKLTSGKVENGI